MILFNYKGKQWAKIVYDLTCTNIIDFPTYSVYVT